VFEKTKTATAAYSFKRLPKLHLRLESTNFYNTVKPHKDLDCKTPYEKLYGYFYDNKL